MSRNSNLDVQLNIWQYLSILYCISLRVYIHGISRNKVGAGCLFAHNTYISFLSIDTSTTPQDFHAKEVESSIARMYDTSWTERVGWTMIMNHLPSNSTSKMRPRASFGLGLFFLISSTDLSAESIHNKTFNGIQMDHAIDIHFQLHQDSNFKTYESWTKTIKPLQEQIKHYLIK